jgi:cytidylate kinase
MGSLGKDVAKGLGEAMGVPVVYHEIIEHLADRMRVRKSHVIRLLDGKAGLLERLSADKVSMFVHSSDEIIASAQHGKGAVIRGWGATHLLRDVPHVVCVRVCAPFAVRQRRMMERLGSDDAVQVADEIQRNDEAHTAIMRRHFNIRWTEPEHYDLVLNTERVSIDECVDEVMGLVQSPEFAETDDSRQRLEGLALSAHVRSALSKSPETRGIKVAVSADKGAVTFAGCSKEELLALVEIAAGVPGVRDVVYRSRTLDEARPRLH